MSEVTLLKKIKFSLLTVILASNISVAAPALADSYGLDATQSKAGLPDQIKGAKTIPELVGVGVEVVLGLFGIIFFLLIFYAGFNWMTAQGNSEKIDESKNTIQGAAIGLIVVLAAYAITNFIFSSLGKGSSNVSAGSQISCSAASSQSCQGKNNGDLCMNGSTQGFCTDPNWNGDGSPTCTCNVK